MSSRLAEFLGAELLPLFRDGEKLLSSLSTVNPAYLDYSFVVFPFAKVYEGFLKKLFLAIGAINDWQYNNERWRVGRALNPQLEKELRHESVYDKLVQYCRGSFDSSLPRAAQDSHTPRSGVRSAQEMNQGKVLADELWRTWKRGRNQIFHFWPGRNRALSLDQAKEIIGEIEKAMERALVECRVKG